MEKADYDIVKIFKDRFKEEVPVLPLPNIEGCDVLYNGPLGQLLVPTTRASSIAMAQVTDWCISWNDPTDHDFDKHSSNLYMWIDVDTSIHGIYVDLLTGKGKLFPRFAHWDGTTFSHRVTAKYQKEFRHKNYIIEFLYSMLETEVLKSPTMSYNYAFSVVKGRWPIGESVIFQNQELVKKYLRVIKKISTP